MSERGCPKCGGQMREGEVYINVTTGSSRIPTAFEPSVGHIMGVPSMQTTEAHPLWRERTGQIKGWLLKREETKTLKISGLRCTECGYLELFVHE